MRRRRRVQKIPGAVPRRPHADARREPRLRRAYYDRTGAPAGLVPLPRRERSDSRRAGVPAARAARGGRGAGRRRRRRRAGGLQSSPRRGG